MSYTEIYTFNKEGNAEMTGEVKNAFRGAMAVWSEIDKKYLPPFKPCWAEAGKIYSRASDFIGGGLREVWDLFDNPKLSESDKIVLGTTFDDVIVMRDDVPKVLEAFKAFEGNTSLLEQAEEIKRVLNEDNDVIAIAWNQTSVNGDAWETSTMDENQEYYLPYNILTGTEHWDLFNNLKDEK